MTRRDVLYFYQSWVDLGLTIWIDGGWGIDALLGEQTRAHKDLDITLQEKELPALLRHIAAEQFVEIPKHDSRAWNFVMGDPLGREIDLHVIVLDEQGNGQYGPSEKGESMYPAQALTGKGHIGDCSVCCISADFQIQSHTGYRLSSKDFHDIRAICTRFEVALPAEYQ